MTANRPDYHALLTVYDLPAMPVATKRRLVKWLRDKAEKIERLSPPAAKEHAVKLRMRLMK